MCSPNSFSGSWHWLYKSLDSTEGTDTVHSKGIPSFCVLMVMVECCLTGSDTKSPIGVDCEGYSILFTSFSSSSNHWHMVLDTVILFLHSLFRFSLLFVSWTVFKDGQCITTSSHYTTPDIKTKYPDINSAILLIWSQSQGMEQSNWEPSRVSFSCQSWHFTPF